MKHVLIALIGTGAALAGVPDGKAVYDKSCKACHGTDGAGNPAIAKVMKVELRSLASPEVQATSDDDLKAAVTKGKGKMKPVSGVTGKALDDLVAYIRSLKK